jgi:hypothetical protein
VVTVAPVPKPPDQLYVVAPVAVNVAVPPLHTVGEFTDTLGNGFTVTVTDAVPVHDPVVPVTVYVVLVFNVGVVTEAPDPKPADQLYVVAPLAVRFAVLPAHIAAGGVDNTVGLGLTVIVAVAVLEHPLVVPVTT